MDVPPCHENYSIRAFSTHSFHARRLRHGVKPYLLIQTLFPCATAQGCFGNAAANEIIARAVAAVLIQPDSPSPKNHP